MNSLIFSPLPHWRHIISLQKNTLGPRYNDNFLSEALFWNGLVGYDIIMSQKVIATRLKLFRAIYFPVGRTCTHLASSWGGWAVSSLKESSKAASKHLQYTVSSLVWMWTMILFLSCYQEHMSRCALMLFMRFQVGPGRCVYLDGHAHLQCLCPWYRAAVYYMLYCTRGKWLNYGYWALG